MRKLLYWIACRWERAFEGRREDIYMPEEDLGRVVTYYIAPWSEGRRAKRKKERKNDKK